MQEQLSFAAGIGASMLSDRLAAAREEAASAAERVQAKAKEAASFATDKAAAVDLSAAGLNSLAESSYDRLREAATSTNTLLNSTVERVASADLRSVLASPGGGGGPGEPSHAQRPQHATEEGSDSGGDDGAHSQARFSGGIASRLGFAVGKSPEKESLIKGSSSGDSGGGNWSGSWAEMGLKQVRDSGLATATSVGSGLGLVAGKPPPPPTGLAKLCAVCPTLTKGQRMLGFVVCFAFGSLLSMSALGSLPSLLLGNPAPFAFKYTFGNLLSLGSSSFLVGPEKQCRDMSAPERRTASLVYVVTLIGTLTCVFVLKAQFLSFCFVVVQFAALTWYMLSYVPYGQQCLKRLLARVTK